MDNYENMFNTICRLCLSRSSTDRMVSLIDNSNEDGLSCFGKAIKTVTDILLQKDDKLPSLMCQKCIYLLKQAVYFKLRCESTDKQLNGLLNSKPSDQSIKEIVCQYVMFNEYFPVKCKFEPSRWKSSHKKPIKSGNFDQKSNLNVLVETNKTNVEGSDNPYDFDNFMDNEDNANQYDDKQVECSNKLNNMLDTIQDIFDAEDNVTIKPRKRRNLRRMQKYRSVTKERNLTCKICHKTLANRLTYNHHIQRHNNCRFICEQCGKGFPVLAEMHMHQVARHGIGPYLQCDHCPYKAPRKLNLIEHLRLHTGERPFTCEKCGLTFRRRAIWRNHLVHHMEKKYQCTYCPRKFYRQASMLAHCNNVHERVYMYMCSICSVTYTKTETVKRHMTVKHGIPREKQGRIMRIMNGSNEFRGKII